ncbi:putative MFS-type transporter [Colletotrichum sp. SAR11_57]|nr:putative MFS-type transporter [Colletotrichum sp. SAR11_57]
MSGRVRQRGLMATTTIPLGAGINGGLNMAQELGVSPAFAIWIIASYPLTQGTALLGSVIFGLFIIIVPGEPTPMDPLGKVDYIGAYLGVCGLILFNFVWTQSALVGWSVPYIYAVLIASILHVAGFVIWERLNSSQVEQSGGINRGSQDLSLGRFYPTD